MGRRDERRPNSTRRSTEISSFSCRNRAPLPLPLPLLPLQQPSSDLFFSSCRNRAPLPLLLPLPPLPPLPLGPSFCPSFSFYRSQALPLLLPLPPQQVVFSC